MQRTRVKVCGITRVEDIGSCVDHGVDALGFVFVEASPRCITIEQAQALLSHVPPFVQTVGLFLDQPQAFIETVLSQVPLNLLQFHGDESPEQCEQFGQDYIKAVPMAGEVDPLGYASRYHHAKGFLLDSHAAGQQGGSGHAFDWALIPKNLHKPLILAGGLNVDNISEAVRRLRPYAVDVSSGVEKQKGIKDPDKIAAFMRGVRQGDNARN